MVGFSGVNSIPLDWIWLAKKKKKLCATYLYIYISSTYPRSFIAFLIYELVSSLVSCVLSKLRTCRDIQ